MEKLHRRRAYTITAASIITLAAAIAAAVITLPLSEFNDPAFLRPRTAAGLVATIVAVGAAIMLVSAMRRFKKSLRISYALTAAGIMLFGIALAQLPVFGFFNAWDTVYANSGLFILPFMLSAILIYAGARRFARLVRSDSIFTSAIFTSCLAITIAVLSFIVAHHWGVYRLDTGNDIYIATLGWADTYGVASTLLMFHIVRRIGPYYQKAMRQLYIALIVMLLGGVHEYFISYWLSNPDWYVSHGISVIPHIITGLAFMRAAYALGALSDGETAATDTLDPTAAGKTVEDHEYTDAITYAASLSSHPDDVDFILDDLRLVTANLEDGQALSPTEKRQLINVYLKVELYLLYHDPLRNFSRREVRSRLSPALHAEIAKIAPDTEPTPNGPSSQSPAP